jgi:hypothetical protein
MAPLKSWLFTSGLGLAVTCGILGWALHVYSGDMLVPEINFDEFVAKSNEEVQKLSAAELWNTWTVSYASQEKLPEWQQAGWKQQHEQGLLLRNIAYGILGLGAVGLLAFLSAIFMPNKKVSL